MQAVSIGTSGVGGFVPPNPEGADSEFHIRLLFFDLGRQLANKGVDVISAPVSNIIEAILAVRLVCLLIWKITFVSGIRVEIIVELDSIDIVLRYNLHHAVNNVLLRFRDAGIEQKPSSVGDHPILVLFQRMLGGKAVNITMNTNPVRVKPSMELQITLLGLLNHKLQRVIAGVAALYTGEPLRPRSVFRRIKRVGRWFDLHNNGVYPERF